MYQTVVSRVTCCPQPPPTDVPILFPRTQEYGTLHGRDFADVIRLRMLSGENILDYQSRPNLIAGVLQSFPAAVRKR